MNTQMRGEPSAIRERTANGTAFELVGPPDAPLVVLIHGLGLNRRVWQWHVPTLAERYRVLSYDLLGHGGSAPRSAAPSLRVFSEQLRNLLDYLAVHSCAIVGFSLGGMINRRFALDNPDRVWALAILNAPHERSPDQQEKVEARAAKVAEGGSNATIESALQRWFTAGFRERHPQLLNEVREWRASADPGSYPGSCEVLATGVHELVRPDPPIDCPTLVMTGEHDSGSTPEMARAIASEIPGARTIIVSDLQHMGFVEEPVRFNGPIIEFLDANLPSVSASPNEE